MKQKKLLSEAFVIAAACGMVLFAGWQANPEAAQTQGAKGTVPFVGCASDGQVGPQAVPIGKSKQVTISDKIAPRLAYYKAVYGPGVLAPRGWHCFSTYGSDGSNLFVSPEPIDTKALFSPDWKGFAGVAIQISVASGGTSGRFQVAKVIARVFPAYKSFAQKVIAEGLEPADDFPFGPYPTDKLTYRSKNVVEFVTPANDEGLGTDSHIVKNANSIEGVAMIIEGDTDLVQLSARLAAQDRDLIPTMIHQVEIEAAHQETK